VVVAADDDYIVTGDADLLVLKDREGIKILRPHDFLEELETE
jgi:predicted nucleic acid-binding protein